jgi:hypothetical protein
MGLGGRRWTGLDEAAPIVRSTRKPPKVWGTVTVEDDSLVIGLVGWRAVWATKRTLRVPLQAVIAVKHDPGAYVRVKTRMRNTRRVRSTMFKVGAQHGMDGWSFWSCGLARNAVVLETVGVRYRYIVVEVADPETIVRTVQEAAGIEPPKPPVPPTVRPITASKRLLRGEKSSPRTRPAGGEARRPAKISSIERAPSRGRAPNDEAPSARPRILQAPAPARRPESAPRTDMPREPDQA